MFSSHTDNINWAKEYLPTVNLCQVNLQSMLKFIKANCLIPKKTLHQYSFRDLKMETLSPYIKGSHLFYCNNSKE